MWKRLRNLWWGKLKERIVDSVANTPCEIEYVNRWGKVVGYWAYGSFDPEAPYQGSGRKYGDKNQYDCRG